MIEKNILILALLYSLSFILGLLVNKANLRVNYSRKLLCILFFLLSFMLVMHFNTERTALSLFMSCIVPLIWLFSFMEVFRSRVRFLAICFASFDRPEDRPYTILWMATGLVAGYIVMLFMIEWLNLYHAAHLIFITVFISSFGDGLAEPIGIRFGQNKYNVRALFTDRIYQRSWEGSACVFLSGIAGIIAMQNYMTMTQFILMLIIIPAAMTLTEAKSPHTWDNPFLHLVGGALTVGILELSQIL